MQLVCLADNWRNIPWLLKKSQIARLCCGVM